MNHLIVRGRKFPAIKSGEAYGINGLLFERRGKDWALLIMTYSKGYQDFWIDKSPEDCLDQLSRLGPLPFS